MCFPSTLHFSSGFPIVIGLHHVEDYKSIKGANPADRLVFRRPNGERVHGVGVTHGYHHYIITTRPRCMFREDNFHWLPSEGKVVGELEFEVAYRDWRRVPFELLLDGSSPYPLPPEIRHLPRGSIRDVRLALGPMRHPNRIVVFAADQSIGLFLEPDLLHFIRVDDRAWPQCFDFKIEYIGISTGNDGQRDFADRLWNHEKVRQIAGIVQRDAPNLQIYVFGYRSCYLIEPAPQRFIENSNILETELGVRASAEVLEAALIGYFRPDYNKEFKDFPDGIRPRWLKNLREILRPAYAPPGPIVLSVSIASDNRHNSNGPWTFGRFYTDHTLRVRGTAEDLCQISIDLSRID